MWDVRGWNRLTDSIRCELPLLAARHEFLSWLAEVPEPHRTSWEKRLKSNLDDPHLSVRLELYLHHYFKSEGWLDDIEPEMPVSPNRPDFRVTSGESRIIVEAKAILDEQTIARYMTRLRQIADNLSGKLSREVIIEPLSDLPPSLPARRIKAQIERCTKTQGDELLEFDLSDEHSGTSYTLKVVVLPKSSDSTEPGGVGGTISGIHTLTIGKRIRDALERKAGKYGSIDIPFVIAVYGAGEFPVWTRDEFDALFGDRDWNVHSNGRATETRRPNGFFTSVREGKRRHIDVSAVLFYRFKWLENTHVHLAHIYHNPFTPRPLSPDLFPGMPQMVPCVNLKWINGQPE